MNKKLDLAIKIIAVVLLLQTIFVITLIYATKNRFSEPIFGDTMLLSVRDDRRADAKVGSLALIDLTSETKSSEYAAFLGGSVRLSKDQMANIGTVKGYVPFVGGYLDFLRQSIGFFLVIILPLFLLVVGYSVRLILIIRDRRATNDGN